MAQWLHQTPQGILSAAQEKWLAQENYSTACGVPCDTPSCLYIHAHSWPYMNQDTAVREVAQGTLTGGIIRPACRASITALTTL